MKTQTIIIGSEGYIELENFLKSEGIKKIFLVCDEALKYLHLNQYFNSMDKRLGISVVKFSSFEPNPKYDSVLEGIKSYLDNECEAIVAVGGGSAIDVAKCIKLFATMDNSKLYLEQEIQENDIPLIAIPTTAGTGSESTKFAVVYYNDEKQSVSHKSSVPSIVILDETLLETLPIYQRKATLLDALCHTTESFWSVNSTEESQAYSKEAIESILQNGEQYLLGDSEAARKILIAANLAGRAINISQTTAAHAMSYKITSLFGLPHGFSVALCIVPIWEYMLENIESCSDERGADYLKETFVKLSEIYGVNKIEDAPKKLKQFIDFLEVETPDILKEENYDILSHSVNTQRLKNNPVALEDETIRSIYKKIFE